MKPNTQEYINDALGKNDGVNGAERNDIDDGMKLVCVRTILLVGDGI
jgi:hypothetical protein